MMVLDLFLRQMRTRSRFMTACLIISVFVKPLVGKPLCDNGLYEHWIAEKKDFVCCREVIVTREHYETNMAYLYIIIKWCVMYHSVGPIFNFKVTGCEAVPCTEHGTEDRVQKCPNNTHQPDATSSRNSPHCIADPVCTDLGIRKECFEGYCWPVCTCSLEHGKCGLNPLDCTDIEKIKCPWKVLEDCSCAPLVITSTLPTSRPSTNMNNTDLSKQSSVSTLRSNVSTTTVPTGRDDDKKDGSEKGNEWIVIGITIGVAVPAEIAVIIALCVCCKCKKDNRLKGAEVFPLLPHNDQGVVMNELNIHVPKRPEHAERVTRQPTPPPPAHRYTGSLPKPVLPGSQPGHNEKSEITNPTGSISSQESIAETKTGADDPDGSDSNQGSNADHGSEEADPSRNHMSHGSEEADPSRNHMSLGLEEPEPSRNHMSHGSEEAGPSRNHMSHGSEEADPSRNHMSLGLEEPDPSRNHMSHGSEEADSSRNHMSHGLEEANPSRSHMRNGLNGSELRSEPDDLSVSYPSLGSSADCRSEKTDVNGHNLSQSNAECGAETLLYPITSLQRIPPICKVTPIVRQVQNKQSTVVSQVHNNHSSDVSQVQTNLPLLGSLGPSLRIDSLLSDNSMGVEEAGNTQPMEQIRELQSGDATPQNEANTLGQFQLCTKAAVSHNCGEQSGAVQAYDPENTDMKVMSQNESSEMNTEAMDSENALLMKVVKAEEFSSDFGHMTGAVRNNTNINVMNKPKKYSLARRNSINCRNVLTADVQAKLNMEPSQEMNSVCHTHGKSEHVIAGQNNSTQNQCSDINASSDERLKVVKDAKSQELDTSQETHPVVNTQLRSFMSGDSLLHTESNNAQSMFPSSATQPGLTEGNNFVGMSLHGRQENPTLYGLGMYTASGENQWSTSREYLSQHSLLSLAQEQSALEKIPPRSVSCPVLHPKFS